MTDFLDIDNFYKITDMPVDEKQKAFDVYQRYLSNITHYIKDEYKTLSHLAAEVANITKTVQSVGKQLDIKHIKRFTYLAWNTEFLIGHSLGDDSISFTEITNTWLPIQVYYSLYSMAEAVVYSMSKQLVENHSKSIRLMSDMFVNRFDIKPFSFAFNGYKGSKRVPSTMKGINFPSTVKIAHPLKRDAISVDSIACCLHAEHRNRIEDKNPKDLRGIYKYQFNPGATTLLHFLYRLRIKSNYKDVEIFLSKAPDSYIIGFSKNLKLIQMYYLMIFEIILVRRLGLKMFSEITESYLKTNNEAEHLKIRLNHYKQNVK